MHGSCPGFSEHVGQKGLPFPNGADVESEWGEYNTVHPYFCQILFPFVKKILRTERGFEFCRSQRKLPGDKELGQKSAYLLE